MRDRVTGKIEVPDPVPAGWLSGVLKAADREPERSRLGGDAVHLSSLVGDGAFCPRATWLARRFKIQLHQSASGAQRVIWAMGRAAERHVRKQLLSRLKGAAYGRWHCNCVETETNGFQPPAEVKCQHCRSPLHHYGELLLRWRGIVGSPDFVFVSGGRLVVVEIKSMNGRDFDALVAPLRSHVRQAQGYTAMLHFTSPHPVDLHPRILYVRKEFKVGDVYKEFSPSQSALPSHGDLEQAFSDGEAAAGETLPPKLPVCGSCNSPRASKCPVLAHCFSQP